MTVPASPQSTLDVAAQRPAGMTSQSALPPSALGLGRRPRCGRPGRAAPSAISRVSRERSGRAQPRAVVGERGEHEAAVGQRLAAGQRDRRVDRAGGGGRRPVTARSGRRRHGRSRSPDRGAGCGERQPGQVAPGLARAAGVASRRRLRGVARPRGALASARRAARARPGPGLPSVSTAASSRPPSRPRFLRKWLRCWRLARRVVSSQNGVPGDRRRHEGARRAPSTRAAAARPVASSDAGADHGRAVDPDQQLGVLRHGPSSWRATFSSSGAACLALRPGGAARRRRRRRRSAASSGRARRRTRVMRCLLRVRRTGPVLPVACRIAARPGGRSAAVGAHGWLCRMCGRYAASAQPRRARRGVRGRARTTRRAGAQRAQEPAEPAVGAPD